MRISLNKFLIRSILILVFAISSIFAAINPSDIVEHLAFKTHIRWTIKAPKDQVIVVKEGLSLIIRSSDSALLANINDELQKVITNNKYVKSMKFEEGTAIPGNISSIIITLTDSSIELFNFYRDREERHILDFWKEGDQLESTSVAESVSKPKLIPKIENEEVKLEEQKSQLAIIKAPKDEVVAKPKKTLVVEKNDLKTYRDFRYGAAFIWDYAPVAPKIKKFVLLESKTPEYFFPILNREFEKNEQEAHIQLTINLFRQKKWGLMYKSIQLFEKKYGQNSAFEINEYIKANALLRENIDQGKREPIKVAITMLGTLVDKTKNYDMKKGILKYLITYYVEKNEYVEVLKLSKKLYVESKINFDVEQSSEAGEYILSSLAKLGQLEVLDGVVQDKSFSDIIAAQTILAYKLYVLLNLNKYEDVIKVYKDNEKSLVAPINESIVFNVAEALFRSAQYDKAIVMFDRFVAQYSYSTQASFARLRIALSYDLLDSDPAQVSRLYEDAINRSQDVDVTYEAKVRYVGFRSVRKISLKSEDREIRIFLERDTKKDLESMNLKKLLWQVRLRTYLADKNFNDALSYLNAIPLNSFKPIEKRVFDSDGAEIVYGLIQDNYKEANYSKLIQIWELYREKYIEKVANDPYLNFIVGKSYLKMGLLDGFERLYTQFNKIDRSPVKTFPLWAERNFNDDAKLLVSELNLIKHINLSNTELSLKILSDLEKSYPNLNRYNYYRGILSSKTKDFNNAVKYYELYLSGDVEQKVYDISDVALMISDYTNALYETNQIEKFLKVSDAILNDTSKYSNANPLMSSVLERVTYLMIELLIGKNKPENLLVAEQKLEMFIKKYPTSSYRGRITFLMGTVLIANKKEDAGKEVLKKLLDEKDVSDYIKEMVRSELSLLQIKERTL